jgi:hypothetical protein
VNVQPAKGSEKKRVARRFGRKSCVSADVWGFFKVTLKKIKVPIDIRILF